MSKIFSTKSLQLLIFALAVFVVSESCASKKRKADDVSKFKKFYHNLTSEFNGYFNANELYETSLVTLQDASQDNYTKILEVDDYVSVADPKMVNSDLDKAIEKVTRVAAIHDIGDWVDDCYVLMGKSQFLKQDYETALETFEYFEEDFNPQNPYGRNYKKKKINKKAIAKERKKERERVKKEREIKKKEQRKEREEKQKAVKKEREDKKKARERLRKERKKNNKNRKKAREKIEKEKKKTGAAPSTSTKTSTGANTKADVKDAIKKEKEEEKPKKDKTAYYEGLIWLAKTYIKVEQYSSAEFLLRKIEDNPSLNNDVRRLLPTVFAELMIKQEDYTAAVVHLEEAIEVAKKKGSKARYHYIIGQILTLEGDSNGAAFHFSKATKFARDYKMKFMAKLSSIKNEIKQGARAKSSGIKKLESMLKEEKNDEFHYLTHFTLGEVHLEGEDIASALESLKSSNTANEADKPIKTEANYMLASYYFEAKDYLNAKQYYDGTKAVMTKTDPRYKKVSKLAANLEGIAQNIITITRLDSLLRMADLPNDELKKIAKEIADANAVKDQMIEDKKPKGAAKSKRRTVRKLSMNSSWFAYNPIAVQSGIKQFKKTWGNRELADNWRRSQQTSLFDEEEKEIDFAEDEEVKEVVVTDDMIQELLPDVPWTVKRKQQYKEDIRLAMFELGKQYKDKVDDNEQSYETVTKLNADYPRHADEAEALYYQYVTALALGKDTNAIKKKLIERYPDTKFAMIMSDPSFADKFLSEEEKVEKYYNQSFELFSQGKFDRVVKRHGTATKQYNDSALMPKFALLYAMAVGNTAGRESYVTSLQQVVLKYPKTEEETKAKEILRFLKGDSAAFNDVNIKTVEETFKMEPDRRHYCAVILFDYSDKALQEAKLSISKYNKKYHSLDRLQMGELILSQTEKTQLILVRSFEGKDDAMTYYEGVMKSRDEFIDPKIASYDVYALSQRNYRKLAQQRTHVNYKAYFEKNYLEK